MSGTATRKLIGKTVKQVPCGQIRFEFGWDDKGVKWGERSAEM